MTNSQILFQINLSSQFNLLEQMENKSPVLHSVMTVSDGINMTQIGCETITVTEEW